MTRHIETEENLRTAEEDLQKLQQQLKATRDPDERDKLFDLIDDLQTAIYQYKTNRWP